MSMGRVSKRRKLVSLFYLNEDFPFFQLMEKGKLKLTLLVLSGNVNSKSVLIIQ